MHKFNPEKLNKLNNPERLKDIPPTYIWKKLHMENPRRIVDIGAGTGFFSVPFITLMGDGELIACDISPVMVSWMKENICSSHPGIKPVLLRDGTVPLEDGSADLVYMINLHHELDDPASVLKEAFRLLKKDGRIFLVDWKKEEMPWGPPVSHRCSISEVAEQLSAAGFGELETDESLQKQFLILGRK